MTTPVTPADLLDVARQLCASSGWNARGWTTRAVALLVRQAVEISLTEYWDATAPAVAAAPRKAQFLLLNHALGADDAAEAHAAWGQLSHACHHRVFDLEPSLDQALRWIAQAERFGESLRAAHTAEH